MVTRGVVFDLDDTLYLEVSYVKSGFRAVARKIGEAVETVSADKIYSFLWENFEAGRRGDNFDQLLTRYLDVARVFSITDLINCYRDHYPDISLLPEATEVMKFFRKKGVKMGILSDGIRKSQELKIDALGLRNLVDSIVLTDVWGKGWWKPNPRGFIAIADQLRSFHEELCYIGDNPEKDFRAANSLGWLTIRLRMPGQLRESLEPKDEMDAPRITIRSLKDLLSILT